MARKLDQSEFKKRIFDIFGDEYTILSEYINRRTEILVRHNKCGEEYLVRADNLLQGKGHFKCNGNKTKTTEDFKEEVRNMLGENYEVVGEYVNNRVKILMKHRICGNEYLQIPKDIITHKSGCPYCGGTKKLTNQEFKERFNSINNGEYELLSSYENMKTKIKIKHNKCGCIFEMLPSMFLLGQGCPKCKNLKTTKTHSRFIEEVNEIYGNKFTVLSRYVNSYTKIKIKCNKCGYISEKTPNSLLKGDGCINCTPCNTSKGVIKIEKYLDDKGIKYLKEYTFDDCKDKGHLRFDFAIFDKNNSLYCLIEFDGEQHFRYTKFFGNKERFYDLKVKDAIKNQYCKNNKIKLVRIYFRDEKNINKILSKELELI